MDTPIDILDPFNVKARIDKSVTFNTNRRLAGEPEQQRDSGDLIETVEIKSNGGVIETTFPLQPVQSGDDKVIFRYGTVHGIVPKIGTDAITIDIDDEDNPKLTVTATGVIYVKVDLAASTYEAENPTLVFVTGDETDIPADVDRVSAHHLLVGVEWDDATNSIKTLSPVHQGSIDVASCAGVSNYWDLG